MTAGRSGQQITARRRLARDVRRSLQIYLNSLEAYIDRPDLADAMLARAERQMAQLRDLHDTVAEST